MPTTSPFALCLLTLSTCLISMLPAFSQVADSLASQISIFDLLPEDQVAEVVITTDMKELEANRKTDQYQPGHIQFLLDKKIVLDMDMKIKCRGKFRRMKCDFPPLKLKFKKKDLQKKGLSELNELKLVTHCLDDRVQSQEMVIREYLIYKLYSIVSNYSFRVRLVKVRYEGQKRGLARIKHYSILVEDGEDLAARFGAERYEDMGVSPDSLDRFQELVTSLFQYMISNADYSYTMCRNTELLRLPDGKILCIPYDFDFSCIVKAPYARANAGLGQQSICDRVYLGFPRPMEEVEPVLQHFEKKKEDLFNFVDEFKFLPRNSREEIMAYLNSFFEEIKDREHIMQVIANSKSIR